MLTRLQVRRFKTFEVVDIELGQFVLLVGPNNKGKTSALQALALWHFGCRTWLSRHGAGEVTSKKPGIALNRKDFVGLPVASALLLWNDLHVREGVSLAAGRRGTQNILIEIIVTGVSDGREWTSGFEFDYANPESVYCRPLKLPDGARMSVPEMGQSIAFLPPMSGLTASETRLPEGRIEVLIGEGRTAEVLRNLCFRVFSEDLESWYLLREKMRSLFGITIQDPRFDPGRGEISLSYLEGRVELDIQCAGRGLQQVLLLNAHLSANRGAVLLLDEPDAHLEILRQREIYNVLTDQAQRTGGQVIAASHSEVLLNEAADRDVVISFVGKNPKRIDDRGTQVLKALKEFGFEHYLQAEQVGKVLYLEGSTDLEMLREFACLLKHRIADFLQRPYAIYVGNNFARARSHFHAVRHAVPSLVGFVLLDRQLDALPVDDKLPARMWKRNEFENYIMEPEILYKYAGSLASSRSAGPLFEGREVSRYQQIMKECVTRRITPAALENADDPWWTNTKASDHYLDVVFQDFFERVGLPNLARKTDYHRLVRFIAPAEVHPDVVAMLDDCASALAIGCLAHR